MENNNNTPLLALAKRSSTLRIKVEFKTILNTNSPYYREIRLQSSYVIFNAKAQAINIAISMTKTSLICLTDLNEMKKTQGDKKDVSNPPGEESINFDVGSGVCRDPRQQKGRVTC
jgi:predicted transport protein